MNYTEEEKQEFRDRDLRIAKESVLKDLIGRLDLEEIYDVEKVIALADKYVNYVYEKLNVINLEDKKEVEKSWVHIAEGLNLATPNPTNIKALNTIKELLDECQTVNNASVNPSDILNFIMTKFGKYPTNQKGISKIVEVYKQ